MVWKVVRSGKKSAWENMQTDATLLGNLRACDAPLLHLYQWQSPAATFGHFIEPSKHVKLEKLKAYGIELARRPTGGGIVFHLSDLAFSVLVPANHSSFSLNPLENYAFINNKVKNAVLRFAAGDLTLLPEEKPRDAQKSAFCMAAPTKYDVMIGTKKMGGAAQRRSREGYLHQGSIFIGALPASFLQEVLVDPAVIATAMQENSAPLLPANWNAVDLERVRGQLSELLIEEFSSC